MSKIAILEQMNGIGGDGMRNENNRTRLLYTILTMTVHVKQRRNDDTVPDGRE
jgi:hypothetical protein